MLRALVRHRRLLVTLAIVVALLGVAAPAMAWMHDHCLQTSDQQHHLPAVAVASHLLVPACQGPYESLEVASLEQPVIDTLLKIPLSA